MPPRPHQDKRPSMDVFEFSLYAPSQPPSDPPKMDLVSLLTFEDTIMLITEHNDSLRAGLCPLSPSTGLAMFTSSRPWKELVQKFRIGHSKGIMGPEEENMRNYSAIRNYVCHATRPLGLLYQEACRLGLIFPPSSHSSIPTSGTSNPDQPASATVQQPIGVSFNGVLKQCHDEVEAKRLKAVDLLDQVDEAASDAWNRLKAMVNGALELSARLKQEYTAYTRRISSVWDQLTAKFNKIKSKFDKLLNQAAKLTLTPRVVLNDANIYAAIPRGGVAVHHLELLWISRIPNLNMERTVQAKYTKLVKANSVWSPIDLLLRPKPGAIWRENGERLQRRGSTPDLEQTLDPQPRTYVPISEGLMFPSVQEQQAELQRQQADLQRRQAELAQSHSTGRALQQQTIAQLGLQTQGQYLQAPVQQQARVNVESRLLLASSSGNADKNKLESEIASLQVRLNEVSKELDSSRESHEASQAKITANEAGLTQAQEAVESAQSKRSYTPAMRVRTPAQGLQAPVPQQAPVSQAHDSPALHNQYQRASVRPGHQSGGTTYQPSEPEPGVHTHAQNPEVEVPQQAPVALDHFSALPQNTYQKHLHLAESLPEGHVYSSTAQQLSQPDPGVDTPGHDLQAPTQQQTPVTQDHFSAPLQNMHQESFLRAEPLPDLGNVNGGTKPQPAGLEAGVRNPEQYEAIEQQQAPVTPDYFSTEYSYAPPRFTFQESFVRGEPPPGVYTYGGYTYGSTAKQPAGLPTGVRPPPPVLYHPPYEVRGPPGALLKQNIALPQTKRKPLPSSGQPRDQENGKGSDTSDSTVVEIDGMDGVTNEGPAVSRNAVLRRGDVGARGIAGVGKRKHEDERSADERPPPKRLTPGKVQRREEDKKPEEPVVKEVTDGDSDALFPPSPM